MHLKKHTWIWPAKRLSGGQSLQLLRFASLVFARQLNLLKEKFQKICTLLAALCPVTRGGAVGVLVALPPPRAAWGSSAGAALQRTWSPGICARALGHPRRPNYRGSATPAGL